MKHTVTIEWEDLGPDERVDNRIHVFSMAKRACYGIAAGNIAVTVDGTRYIPTASGASEAQWAIDPSWLVAWPIGTEVEHNRYGWIGNVIRHDRSGAEGGLLVIRWDGEDAPVSADFGGEVAYNSSEVEDKIERVAQSIISADVVEDVDGVVTVGLSSFHPEGAPPSWTDRWKIGTEVTWKNHPHLGVGKVTKVYRISAASSTGLIWVTWPTAKHNFGQIEVHELERVT